MAGVHWCDFHGGAPQNDEGSGIKGEKVPRIRAGILPDHHLLCVPSDGVTGIKLGFTHLHSKKPIFSHQIVVKDSAAYLGGCQTESGIANARKFELCSGFHGGILKAR